MLILLLLAGVLFCVENSSAYSGYFSDDDLSTLVWARVIPFSAVLHGFFSPRLADLRPSGVLYFFGLVRAAGLHFVPFLAVLQVAHLLNACLLFLTLRQLGFDNAIAASGTLFYAFNAVISDAYWKPMYVYDTLCATWCLVTLLLYMRGHWLIAVVPFWLAYKSKELAVMMPLALAAYELLLSSSPRWKRLVPYFLISVSFGLQALIHNTTVAHYSPYSLRFSRNALIQTLTFYSSALMSVRYAWIGFLALPFFIRDRKLYFGLIFMAATFVPLLFLPGRLYAVYWYVPMLGLAIAFAAMISRAPRWVMVFALILWIPFNWSVLRNGSRALLDEATDRRDFVMAVFAYSRTNPIPKTVVYEGAPRCMQPWGIEGVIHLACGLQTRVLDRKSAEAQRLPAGTFVLIQYDPARHSIMLEDGPAQVPASFLQ